MSRPSVLERILPRVEAMIEDIDECRRSRLRDAFRDPREYELALADPANWTDDERLPETADGKVNVKALVERLELRPTDAQHFYKRAEIYGPINQLAREQGLKPIKSRAQQDAEGDASRERIVMANAESKRLAEQLMEVSRERDMLRARLAFLEEQGWIPRTGKVAS